MDLNEQANEVIAFELIRSEKYVNNEADDLIESLNQWIPSTTTTTTTTNLDLFLSKLKNENEYAPFGEQILSCELNGEKSTSYLINRVNQNFCDDKNSLNVLILPPYQRKGHGRRLLTAIYNDLRKDSRVQDITAEDPSDEFVALRDLVALELCHKYLPDFFSKEASIKMNRLTKEMIDKAPDISKLTKQETRRVHVMCFYQAINENDEKKMKRFRLLVKQRLFEPLQFDKRRRLRSADPALEALATDPEKRKKYSATQYEYVLEHYENILRAFDKYQDRLYN
ncbi:unnamed protein product [Rotaria socialis]|uniref:Histone acetyltransferase type B catalytic subunit n=1 Tax=Rotaria socialis TaxID=392032 RepID=A0A818ESN3_9BILA|nr:unnamed protein product [Rotaria socialis]